MKPPPFEYRAPETLDEAVALLAADPGAKPIAGGPGRASSRSSGGVAEVKFFGRYKAGYIRDAVVLTVQDGV